MVVLRELADLRRRGLILSCRTLFGCGSPSTSRCSVVGKRFCSKGATTIITNSISPDVDLKMHPGHQEFNKLKPENTVYKLIGPVLVPQEQAEAKVNVAKRLDYIKGDMCVPRPCDAIISTHTTMPRSVRVEKQLKELSEKSEKKKTEARKFLKYLHLLNISRSTLQIVEIQAAAQGIQQQTQEKKAAGKAVAL
jgi:Prefoldin subunit